MMWFPICSRLRLVFLPGLTVLLLAGAALTAQSVEGPPPMQDRFTLERYLDLEGVSGPRISPDGRQIVYVRQWVDKMTDTRKSALWIMNVNGSRNRYLSEGSSPRWSPSGDRLAFLACGTAGGDRSALIDCGEGSHQQIYVRIMSGDGLGTATQITRITESASNIQWSHDGATLAFNQFVPARGKGHVTLPGKPEGAKWTEDARVIDKLDYRQDRRGLARNGTQQIFTVPADGATPRLITHGDYDSGEPQWSLDDQTIFFDGFRRPGMDHEWYAGSYLGRPSKIYAVDIATREIRELIDHVGVDENPIVAPDGRLIAYESSDPTDHTYVNRRLHLMNVDGSSPRAISGDFDRRFRNTIWAPDGSGVYLTADNAGTRDLYFASLEGTVRRVTEGSHTLDVTHVNRNGLAVGVLSTPQMPSEVVSMSLARPSLERLTHVNEDVLANLMLGEVEDFWYDSVGGLRVQGWTVKPPDFDPSVAYPLLLSIHGGPHSQYTFAFNASFQNFAANDYVVLYTNPRGSSGYGTAFGDGIENDYPGKDFNDLMQGVDAVLERGYVDRANLFVAGCSGGGTLTGWTVTQTDRFAAASARCMISNWISFIGTTDGTSWYRTFEKFPWEDPSDHLRRSPLMHVENVTTPTLIMVGEYDLRTPVPQSEEFYVALKMLKVPTKMILMQEEWHGTTRKPSNFMRTQIYEMEWFEQYMTGELKKRRTATSETGPSLR